MKTDGPAYCFFPVGDCFEFVFVVHYEDKGDVLRRDINIVLAQERDLDLVIGILEEAGQWVQSKGYGDQWRPGSFSREVFSERIRKGEVYLAKLGEETVGTATVQWSDEEFWGVMPPDAAYLHKFAVSRKYTGRGIGLQVLGLVENLARSAGKEFLRLDCLAGDQGIGNYYEKAGFCHVRDVDRPRWKASLYEKKLKTQN